MPALQARDHRPVENLSLREASNREKPALLRLPDEAQTGSLGSPEERMSPELWKREKLAEIQARIQIEEAILQALRDELAELDHLAGPDLRMRFGWESPDRVAETMREKREYEREILKTWLAGEHNLKSKGQAA